MTSFSVIVPVHNNAGVIRRTLRSADEAVAFWRRANSPQRAAAEIVVVDDGSTDGTPEVVREIAGDREDYRVLRCPRPAGAAHARNLGVANARGEILFFLDGDDLFRPEHVAACLQVLEARPEVDFVKTGVALADPVHPEWKKRIENSLVLNLCVRRPCHDFIEGFPEFQLFRRTGDQYRQLLDAVGPTEDVFYNTMLARLFRGWLLPRETVQYLRYPGNAYDRQYARFQHPPEEAHRFTTPEEIWYDQLRLLLMERHLRYLGKKQQDAAAPW